MQKDIVQQHIQTDTPLPEQPQKNHSWANPPVARFPIFLKVFSVLLTFGLVPLVFFLLFMTFHFENNVTTLEKTILSGSSAESISKDIARMRYDIRIRSGFIIALLLGSSITGIFLISRHVSSPLGKMLIGMQRLGEGKYGAKIDIQTNDEFTIFAHYFNVMSGRLKTLRDRERWIMQAKSRLLGLAAHQLRTPLTAIQWILTELNVGSYDPVTSKQQEVIKKGETYAWRMINLINALLKLTSIEEGKFGFSFKKASFLPFVWQIVQEMTPQAELKHIQLSVKINAKEIPEIFYDEEKMRFVLENILANAIRYNHAGGKVFITLDAKEGNNSEPELIIAVQDTGIGMSEDEMKHLFTEFYRSQEATFMYLEGSGLGLFISRNIIEGHGGKIWAKSSKGEGSTFYFTLPMRQSQIPHDEYSKQFVIGE